MSEASEPSRKAPTRAPFAPPYHDDEISLRELYLILRRGLPLILGIALVAGTLAAGYTLLAPDRYESEVTVISAPTTVQLQGDGALAFEPRSSIEHATYASIATNLGTLEATLARLEEDGVETPGDVRDLLGAITVERLTGPATAGAATPLTVVHRVAWSDPVLAARYADAWAEVTVAQVRTTLVAGLEPARTQMIAELEQREAALVDVEQEYRDFERLDLPGLERELRTVDDRIAANETDLQNLDRDIAALEARRTVLSAQVGSEGDVVVDPDALDLLAGTERLDPAIAAQLRQLGEAEALVSENDTSLATEGTLALLARADLQSTSVSLGGLLRERAAVQNALATSEARSDALRDRIADLRLEDARLTRRLQDARNAYEAVRSIEPALAFVANLTPANTRVVNTAQPATGGSAPGTALVAGLAATIAAIVATLFVFLREAIREPKAPTAHDLDGRRSGVASG